MHVLDETETPDQRLARQARFLLEKAANIDHTTLSVSADGGWIVLTGTAGGKAELERVLDLLRSLDGARDVANLAIVSPRQKQIDHRRRDAAQAAVDGGLPPSANVKVSLFGPVAVISGQVSGPGERREAEAIVGRQAPVNRVVNQIDVDPRS